MYNNARSDRLDYLVKQVCSTSAFRFLVFITALYILWQISLCGSILTADSIEKGRSLSELAKKTVGFGMFLFVFRAYCNVKLKKEKLTLIQLLRERSFVPVLIISLLSGWAAMWAEDATVNHFADKSTGRERLEAKMINMFNSAFLQGKVKLPDLPQSISRDIFGARTFAKTLGFAIWTNPRLIRQIKGEMRNVFMALYGQIQYDRIDAGYDEYVKKHRQLLDRLAVFEVFLRRNLASDSAALNHQLGKYAECSTNECREKINRQTAAYVSKNIGDFDFDLSEFCRKVPQISYHMGKPISSGEGIECSVTEEGLHAWLLSRRNRLLDDALSKSGLPESVIKAIDWSKPVTPEEWRSKLSAEVRGEIEKKEKEEFENPGRYADGGKEAAAGRDYVISVFLPPVALGFSVSVCFLHLASLAAAFIRRQLLCFGVAATVWIAPALFATSVPLGGFWGIYAKWLVFWEKILCPLGILRWIII